MSELYDYLMQINPITTPAADIRDEALRLFEIDRNELHSEIECQQEMACDLADDVKRLEKERDELKAKLEVAEAGLQTEYENCEQCEEERIAALDRAVKAEAEVERLQGELDNHARIIATQVDATADAEAKLEAVREWFSSDNIDGLRERSYNTLRAILAATQGGEDGLYGGTRERHMEFKKALDGKPQNPLHHIIKYGTEGGEECEQCGGKGTIAGKPYHHTTLCKDCGGKGTIAGKDADEVDRIMQTIPAGWRYHWCGGERGPCACMGCVQIGNRLIMVEEWLGFKYRGDPEYIDETKIPREIYNKYKIYRQEWVAWKARHPHKSTAALADPQGGGDE